MSALRYAAACMRSKAAMLTATSFAIGGLAWAAPGAQAGQAGHPGARISSDGLSAVAPLERRCDTGTGDCARYPDQSSGRLPVRKGGRLSVRAPVDARQVRVDFINEYGDSVDSRPLRFVGKQGRTWRFELPDVVGVLGAYSLDISVTASDARLRYRGRIKFGC